MSVSERTVVRNSFIQNYAQEVKIIKSGYLKSPSNPASIYFSTSDTKSPSNPIPAFPTPVHPLEPFPKSNLKFPL